MRFNQLPLCSYRDKGCDRCPAAVCLHATRGAAFGELAPQVTADGTLGNVRRVKPEDCKRCVGTPDEAVPILQALKSRGSLADAVKARAECVPCQNVAPVGSIAIRGYIASYTGYGQIGGWVGKGLEANDVPARFLNHFPGHQGFLPDDPWVVERVVGAPAEGSTVLQCAIPHTPLIVGFPTVALSMWEASRIGADAVACLNGAEAVIVPCRWNADGFAASGVTRPIHVVPMGVAASDGYTPKLWPTGKPFTFGMAGRMAHGGIRKGLNEGMAAFAKAFGKGQDVRMEVKVYPDCVPVLRVPDDPRIEIIIEPMTPGEMAEWYGGIDCLFVPSKGEGFGLHSAQALACGRPIIASLYGGTVEFATPRCCLPLDYIERPAREFYGGVGNWAEPTEESMVGRLRQAFTDPGFVRMMGAAGVERMKAFTWERTGVELVRVMREAGAIR